MNDAHAIDPRRAMVLAREYDMLQGLFLVVAGIGLSLYGFLFPTRSGLGPFLLLTTISVGFPLTTWWYAKHYGRTRSGWKRNLAGAAISLLALTLILLTLGVDHFEQLPVLLSMLVTAAFLWGGIRLGARRLGMTAVDHVIPAVLGLASLAPLAVGPAAEFPAVSFYFTVTGLALIPLGLAWHRRLVTEMGGADASSH